MIDGILNHYSEHFRRNGDVAAADAGELFDAIIGTKDEAVLAGLLLAWNEKGTSEDELFAFVQIMRNRMKRVNSTQATFVDAVGTGGSRAKTFNVSTAAAFVIAGAGVPVAKHGNRAATSSSGSSDALSLLGVNADVAKEIVERCLNDHGLCFMFAPRFHSLSPTLAAVRRSLRTPTVFNNLGPLCNPASAPHQLIGVWDERLVDTTGSVLARLGTTRSWIVHAKSGLDEIGLSGSTLVAEIANGEVSRFEISAADFGIDLAPGRLPVRCSSKVSASLIREILDNKEQDTGAETLVLLNAAAAIYITGFAATLRDAFEMARQSIRNGGADNKLETMRRETNR